MTSDLQTLAVILVIAVMTILLRFLPFAIFHKSTETPPFLVYLGKVLPYAIMGILVIYCLKNVSLLVSPNGLPELIAVALVAGLHIWKRNTLLSIAAGTVCYMLLVQNIF